jgi:NAD(P)-dependent dehydrogenase (short-subunit alcohol dehydrogenase family)
VRDQVDAAIAVATAGGAKIDIVIANAGISSPASPFEDYPLDGFERVLKVHVVGAFHTIQAALPHVPDGASIIITSSVAGLVGTPQVSAYGTAKHAQIGLMRSLAVDLAPRGIRVNTINPGPVDNEFQTTFEERVTGQAAADANAIFDSMIPLGRHIPMVDIAYGMLYLAGPHSTNVTSTIFRIDGGMGG